MTTTANNASRKPTTPTAGAVRDGSLAALIGLGLGLIGLHNGVPPELIGPATGAAAGAVVGVGKSIRDFRASGQGGLVKWVWSWVGW